MFKTQVICMISDLDMRLKISRLKKRMSQKTVADLLNTNRSTISAYETGSITPSPEMLMRLARLYSVSMDYLVGLERKRSMSLDGLNESQIETVEKVADEFRLCNQGEHRQP